MSDLLARFKVCQTCERKRGHAEWCDQFQWFRLVVIIEDEYGNQVEGYMIEDGGDLEFMQARMHQIGEAAGGVRV